MTHDIIIESIGQDGSVEWRETITAASKSAARRKANSLVRSTGETTTIDKRVNQYDSSIEMWTLK